MEHPPIKGYDAWKLREPQDDDQEGDCNSPMGCGDAFCRRCEFEYED